jgi:hypothetical protein
MTEDDIAKRLTAAGITLKAAEHADLAGAYAMLAPMLQLIRTPTLPPEAEPAVTFAADR